MILMAQKGGSIIYGSTILDSSQENVIAREGLLLAGTAHLDLDFLTHLLSHLFK